MNAQQNADRFRSQLSQWVESEGQRIVQEVRQTVAAIQAEVVFRTPIKTGRAASNWHVELGGPNFDVDPSIDDDDESTWISKSEALSRAQQDLSDLSRLSISEVYDVYVSNGTHYIVDLEQGSSPQAGAGFMAEGAIQHAAAFLPVIITGPVEKGG